MSSKHRCYFIGVRTTTKSCVNFFEHTTNRDFTVLEKAFAKLYGCYENLVGGQLADALQGNFGVLNAYTVDSRYNAIEEFSRYIESYFKGFLVVGTEEFSRYIKSFTGLALYRESTV
jgi:hypothetical protein